MTLKELPVCVFCATRHSGAVCANGKVPCALCFGMYPIEGLNNVGWDGVAMGRSEDVCIPCAEKERVQIFLAWAKRVLA